MENLPTRPARPALQHIGRSLLIVVTAMMFGVWLYFTPSGILGKADAAGYAVCHRISARSFHIGERQTPLCARCSGMYLGALLGMAYSTRYGRRAGMPAKKVLIVLAFFLAAFAVDGGNSYLHLFPGMEGIYEPANWLRLATGTGLGLGIAAILVPIIHQTLWQSYDPRPALAGWRDFLPLLGLAGLVNLALLSDIPAVLYPLALLSAASIFIILTLVYMIVWILITKQDNRFTKLRQAWVTLAAGFLTALVQVGLFDAARFWLTRTWEGFNLF